MQKVKIDKFIQKYNLGGNVNSVRWKSNGTSLSTSFVTDDKSLKGTVTMNNSNIESSEIGVYSTDILQKLLTVLNNDISISLSKFDNRAVTLNVSDDSAISFDYQLADLSVINNPPELKRLPDFQTQIKVDSNFIGSFIKGKSALADVETFTILNDKGQLKVIIGYSSINTNRVNIPVETMSNGIIDPITFNANLFKEVLSANSNCTSAILEVSNDGLARINFKIDDYDSTYYIVATQGVD
tara:strand:+ start:82 stop:804 length:723 start_codon:yes stop_codon:yes gene_type:complete